jgi:DNA-binding NarL/FixJ family response regulator
MGAGGGGSPWLGSLGSAASVEVGAAEIMVANEQLCDVHQLDRDRNTSPATKIRIVVAEDNLLVREGLLRLLEGYSDFVVAAICEDYPSLLTAVETASPHVVITDIRMPPTQEDEGIRVANGLRESHPEIGVVVVSQHADPSYALALLERGSSGRAYLLKERIHRTEELAAAVKAVAAGESMIDPVVVESLVTQASRGDGALSALTRREREILDLMAQGRNNGGIAAELHLSEHSVEKYVSSILAKLDLGPTADVHRRVKAVLVYLSEH